MGQAHGILKRAVAVVAAIVKRLPARRPAKVDPLIALRHD
jgi:hypothetical protein